MAYKNILRFLRPYLPQILLGSLCTALVAASTLVVAPAVGLAFKAIEEKDLLLLNMVAAGIVGLYIVKGLFTYFQDFLSYYIANRVITNLRTAFYRHLQTLSLDFYGRWHTGELTSRVMNDITMMQTTILTSFTAIIPQTVLLIALLGYIFWLNWRLSLLTLVALPLIIKVIQVFAGEIRHISEKVQQKTADITSHFQETVAQIRTVKSFTMEEAETEKFSAENKNAFSITMKVVKILAMQNPIIALLQATAAVGIVWYGGLEIINGQLTLPQLISFATALGIMTDPGSTLSKAFAVIQQGVASAQRVLEILEIKPSVVEAPNTLILKNIRGQVEFKNVSFAYEKELVLKNINLSVSPGEAIALIGRTGAGKSTLVNLLPRFYDPTAGQILIDGYDLRQVSLHSLRQQIAIVPQEVALFRGTIKSNIAYGRPEASDSEIEAAARQANAHNFITALPEGYQTEVGERGGKLSGGERQRIAIARAILRNPRILILDEATSALDAETEALIRDALDKLMKGRTTFIIAHRLYTVEKADRVIVMEGGQIIESGTHSELMSRDTLYRRLYEKQLQNKDNE